MASNVADLASLVPLVDVLAKILASLQKVVGDKGVSAVVGKSGKGGENHGGDHPGHSERDSQPRTPSQIPG
jgi:hypothetical protein